MFRPTLKRIAPLKNTIQSTRHTESTYRVNQTYQTHTHTTKQLSEQGQMIIPSKLLKNPTEKQYKNHSHVFSPLSYHYMPYPEKVKNLITNSQDDDQMGIGIIKKLCYFYLNQNLYLWHESQHYVRNYQLPDIPDALEIGQIKDAGYHFKNQNSLVMVVGIQNYVYLYSVDKQTLKIDDLSIKHRIWGSFRVQKIKFVEENQIVLVSDTGAFLHLDYNSQEKISMMKTSFMAKLVPSKKLIYDSEQRYTENFIFKKDKIYALVRTESKRNFLMVKMNQFYNKIFDIPNDHNLYINQNRHIEVYRFNRVKRYIEREFMITEKQIKDRIRRQSIYQDRNQQVKSQIKCIFEPDQKRDQIGLIMEDGKAVFIAIKGEYNAVINQQIVNFPQPNLISQAGIFISKKIENLNYKNGKEDGKQPQLNVITSSLGFNNISILRDSITYFSNSRIDSLKCQGMTADLIERTHPHGNRQWLLFSRKGYFTLTLLEYHQLLLLFVYYRYDVLSKEIERSWEYDSSFHEFVSFIGNTLGNIKLCEMLLQILMMKKDTVLRVNQNLIQVVKEEMMGHKLKDYRDWNYRLNQNSRTIQITLTEQLISKVWGILLEQQFREVKLLPTQELSHRNVNCTCYWFALQHVFYRTIQPLLNTKISDFKLYCEVINSVQDKIKNIEGVILQKKEKEAGIRKNISRKQTHEKATNKIWIHETLSTNDTRMDQNLSNTAIQNTVSNKIVVQSSLELEEILLKSLTKIRELARIYHCLFELKEREDIPTIQSVLSSKHDQIKLKEYILRIFSEKVDQLERLSFVLPELEIGIDLQFIRWKQISKLQGNTKDINLNKLACILHSRYFKDLKDVFGDRWDFICQCLLYYVQRMTKDLESINHRHEIASKNQIHNSLFAEDSQKLSQQRKELMITQIKKAQYEIQSIISLSLNSYLTSPEEKYYRNNMILDQLIQSLVTHNDESLMGFFENQIRQKAIYEKIELVQRLKRRKGDRRAIWEKSDKEKVNYSLMTTFDEIRMQNK